VARSTALSRARLHLIEDLRLAEVKEAAWGDPKPLIAEINAFDPTTMEHFKFTMYPSDADPFWPNPHADPRAVNGWLFQAAVVDWLMGKESTLFELLESWSPNWQYDEEAKVFLILKARQLGITWLVMAIELWHLLFKPGSNCVAYSYNEEQSKKLIVRAWLMFNSIPEALRSHVEVITPSRHDEPSEWIRVRHKESGLTSTIQSLPATKKAGHGDTITFGLMDEAAYQDYCKQIFTACLPATQRGNARLAIVSTANGVGNPDTEEGNFFSILYQTQRSRKISFAFLPWNAEPTRDEKWYADHAMKLGEVDRNRQYPKNEADAFMLSGALFFDRDALRFYRTQVRKAGMVGQFVQRGIRSAEWMSLRDGMIAVFEKPVTGRKYALCADTSTGRGQDYTSMGIIDLETGAIVCELHARIEASRSHLQAFSLGRWYNDALICVERQGGYGEALITLLRDGANGLPPYARLYRHMDATKGKRPMSESIGIPMGATVRPGIVNNLADWIRQRLFPWVSQGQMDELGTFVYHTAGVSPAALQGSHDDRVMMLGMCAEMFRQFGRPPAKKARRGSKSKYEPHPSRSST